MKKNINENVAFDLFKDIVKIVGGKLEKVTKGFLKSLKNIAENLKSIFDKIAERYNAAIKREMPGLKAQIDTRTIGEVFKWNIVLPEEKTIGECLNLIRESRLLLEGEETETKEAEEISDEKIGSYLSSHSSYLYEILLCQEVRERMKEKGILVEDVTIQEGGKESIDDKEKRLEKEIMELLGNIPKSPETMKKYEYKDFPVFTSSQWYSAKERAKVGAKAGADVIIKTIGDMATIVAVKHTGTEALEGGIGITKAEKGQKKADVSFYFRKEGMDKGEEAKWSLKLYGKKGKKQDINMDVSTVHAFLEMMDASCGVQTRNDFAEWEKANPLVWAKMKIFDPLTSKVFNRLLDLFSKEQDKKISKDIFKRLGKLVRVLHDLGWPQADKFAERCKIIKEIYDSIDGVLSFKEIREQALQGAKQGDLFKPRDSKKVENKKTSDLSNMHLLAKSAKDFIEKSRKGAKGTPSMGKERLDVMAKIVELMNDTKEKDELKFVEFLMDYTQESDKETRHLLIILEKQPKRWVVDSVYKKFPKLDFSSIEVKQGSGKKKGELGASIVILNTRTNDEFLRIKFDQGKRWLGGRSFKTGIGYQEVQDLWKGK